MEESGLVGGLTVLRGPVSAVENVAEVRAIPFSAWAKRDFFVHADVGQPPLIGGGVVRKASGLV